MKKILAGVLFLSCLLWFLPGCDTQKPANEVEDAKSRVKDNIEGEREKQKEQSPDEKD